MYQFFLVAGGSIFGRSNFSWDLFLFPFSGFLLTFSLGPRFVVLKGLITITFCGVLFGLEMLLGIVVGVVGLMRGSVCGFFAAGCNVILDGAGRLMGTGLSVVLTLSEGVCGDDKVELADGELGFLSSFGRTLVVLPDVRRCSLVAVVEIVSGTIFIVKLAISLFRPAIRFLLATFFLSLLFIRELEGL